MKCRTCGGKLIFKNGIYVCDSCGSRYNNTQVFENIDVLICYREYDDFGKRTEDSIIANDIYSKLEARNISTFYERISLDGLSGDDYELWLDNALLFAKIVVVFAKSKENFNQIVQAKFEKFKDKKILPIYSGINAYDLPKQLKGLQALNYDNIGADEDIVKNILTLLGRSAKLDIEAQYNKKVARKKKTVTTICSFVAIGVVATLLFIVFFTPFVLSENKYKYASERMANKDRIGAIEALYKIPNYKDSDKLIKELYNEYDGFYEHAGVDLTVTLTVIEKNSIELICNYPKGKFDITAVLNQNVSKFVFRDSIGEQGNGILELTNTGIRISIYSEFFDTIEASFTFEDKKDKKLNTVNKETLLSWLDGDTTIQKLHEEGYDFGFKETVHANFGKIYVSKELPVEIFVSDTFHPDNELVTAISAPAGILTESHIGNSARPFLENGVIYAPYGEFPNSSLFSITNYKDDVSNMQIYSDTPVYITTEDLVNLGGWEHMLYEINKTK